MLPSLDGISLKVKRSYQQIDILKNEISTFMDREPYKPAFKMNRIRGATEAPCVLDFTIRLVVEEPCPPMFGILVGEIVHNLRSALDHIVYQLVIHATNAPPPVVSKTQFPIFLDAAGFKHRGPLLLKGVGTKAAALIKAMQPFATGEGVKSPLWHLSQLSNIDKHRTIHLTGGTLEAFNFEFSPELVTEAQITKRVKEAGAFQNNTIVAEGRLMSDIYPFGSSCQVEMQAKVTFNVVFDKSTPFVGDWLVVGTLLDAADRSRDCIAKISSDVLSTDFTIA
jgi:hypothetical protein